ncbi:MAG: cell division/cell wall cluster transcriptional repressor MraZ [Rickettsiales bacterium]
MLFLSTFQNRIDKKGRVSVPASFRSAVAANVVAGGFVGVVAYPSPINECIEACGMSRIVKLNERIEQFDPYSEEKDAFITTLFGESVQLSFDTEGRVMLPEKLIELASLKEQATFVGKGDTFDIWEPKAFAAYSARARLLVKEKRFMMKGQP